MCRSRNQVGPLHRIFIFSFLRSSDYANSKNVCRILGQPSCEIFWFLPLWAAFPDFMGNWESNTKLNSNISSCYYAPTSIEFSLIKQQCSVSSVAAKCRWMIAEIKETKLEAFVLKQESATILELEQTLLAHLTCNAKVAIGFPNHLTSGSIKAITIHMWW